MCRSLQLQNQGLRSHAYSAAKSYDGSESMNADKLLYLGILLPSVGFVLQLVNEISQFKTPTLDSHVRYTIGALTIFVCVAFRKGNAFFNSAKKTFVSVSPESLKKTLSSSEALSRLSKVSSAQTLKRLSTSIREGWGKYASRNTLKAISRKECFAKSEYIAQLSIQDFVALFRYVAAINRIHFDRREFMSSQSKLVRCLVTAMDAATTASRGGRTRINMLSESMDESGQIDALYFAAIVRIFIEWRSIRMVPSGYNRYAVALNLGHRDVIQNLSKLEEGVHNYINYHQSQDMRQNVSVCPTLRDLLQYEIDRSVHPGLPRLKDNSAAAGILWTKRQLHYQTSLLANSLEVPLKFATPHAGALAAYEEVYDEYHGWAVKQVFKNAFGGSPPIEKIWKEMVPSPACEVDHTRTDDDWLQRKLSDISESEESADNEFLAAIEDFGRRVAKNWEGFLRRFNCVEHKEETTDDQTHSTTINENLFDVKVPILEERVSLPESLDMLREAEMITDPIAIVKTGTLKLVREIRPLLQDITDAIEEFNMNDPAKA